MTYFRSKPQQQFSSRGNYAATQYPRWINESGSYEVVITGDYEPWVIVHRSASTCGQISARCFGPALCSYWHGPADLLTGSRST